jgi:hypothetical protein
VNKFEHPLSCVPLAGKLMPACADCLIALWLCGAHCRVTTTFCTATLRSRRRPAATVCVPGEADSTLLV